MTIQKHGGNRPHFCCELSQYTVIGLQGEDSEKFLQGQLTCDVTKLASGDCTLTAHCDPKGKMNSLFYLIRLDTQRFYLLLRKTLLPSALDQLKKYAVFSKVTFAPVEAQITGISAESALIKAVAAENGVLVNPHYVEQNDIAHRIVINPKPQPCRDSNTAAEYWDYLEITQGIPLLSRDSQNEFIPQAVNLQCIGEAVSFHKGCYIGQETVARAKYRGADKRAMFVFNAHTEALPIIGGGLEMQLENGRRKTGSILSAVVFDGILWLQAVLNNELDPHTPLYLPDGIPLTHCALPYVIEH